MRALILSGILDEANELRLQIPLVSDVPQAVGANPGSDETVSADLLDAQGNVVSHAMLDAATICAMPSGPPATPPLLWLVSGAIPMPDGTAALRLTWRGQVIHQSQATAGRPSIQLTWQPPQEGAASGPQIVTWKASHPDAAPLRFILLLRFSDGSQQIVASVSGQQVDIDFDLLPPNRIVQLAVVASDGFHLASDESSAFFLFHSNEPIVPPS